MFHLDAAAFAARICALRTATGTVDVEAADMTLTAEALNAAGTAVNAPPLLGMVGGAALKVRGEGRGLSG